LAFYNNADCLEPIQSFGMKTSRN